MRPLPRRRVLGHLVPVLLGLAALPPSAAAQAADPLTAPYPAAVCPSCAAWDEPQRPLRVHGDTYYVGTRGLGAVLITSPAGHVLIDGALPSSAPEILDHIRELGFRVRDVKLILNSHAHFDHAGGIAALQRATGARVAASPASAAVLRRGRNGPDDPQHGVALDFPPVPSARRFSFSDTLRVGSLQLVPHETPGHAPGGTSWSWRSCSEGRCLDLVYADSQTPVSADGFRFGDHPALLADFERGLARLESLPCDVLITPHPGASALWDRLAAGPGGLVDRQACRRYAAHARQQVARRLKQERAGR